MANTYTRTNLKNSIWDSVIAANASSQVDVNDVCNVAVRNVLRKVDLRSSKRLAAVIDMFSGIYDYTCPSDIYGVKIIDVVPQVNRSSTFDIDLVGPAEFDRRKTFDKNLVSFNDHDMARKIRLSVITNSISVTIANLDSLTSGGGTWVATGDAQNVRVDTQNFVEGTGSLLWDIGTGATGNGGIQNTTMNSFDITNFLLAGSVFAYVYIQTITNLTNFRLRIGSSSSNYYQMQVTTDNSGSAFQTGWMLLRFDLSGATITGSPVKTACTFVQLTENSSAAITSSNNWRFDGVTINNGQYSNILYYSKFLWQDTTGAYKENSTLDTDLLNCDTEEMNLFVLAGRCESDSRLNDWNSYSVDKAELQEALKEYMDGYPSEAKMYSETYYDTEAGLNYNPDLNTIDSEDNQMEELT